MSSNKSEINFKDKKYLLYILGLMIVAAIGLSIVNLFKQDEKKPLNQSGADIFPVNQTADAKQQSYLVEKGPSLRENDQVIGNREAALKIFVYEDYNDVFSAESAKNINSLINKNGSKLAFVFRPYVGSESKSVQATFALDCAAKNDKWEAMRMAIFNGLEKAPENVEAGQELFYYADSIGLNKDEFISCLTNAQKSGRIEELQAEINDYKIQGSPTLFINEEIILGARPLKDYVDSNGDTIEGLETVIERLLK